MKEETNTNDLNVVAATEILNWHLTSQSNQWLDSFDEFTGYYAYELFDGEEILCFDPLNNLNHTFLLLNKSKLAYSVEYSNKFYLRMWYLGMELVKKIEKTFKDFNALPIELTTAAIVMNRRIMAGMSGISR